MPETTTWWKCFGYMNGLEPVEVTRSTLQSVWISHEGRPGRRQLKHTTWARYFPTFEEAYDWHVARLKKNISHHKNAAQRNREDLAAFKEKWNAK